jgi:hypothetical protein
MKQIHELKTEKGEKISLLLKECNVFFAFSDEQFNKNKTPLKDGEKYVRLQGGGFVPKSFINQFLSGCADVEKWYKAEAGSNKKIRIENIKYELSNYECYYTGEIDEAIQALGKGYTRKEVLAVFQKERLTIDI